ncbi:gp436 family protein [Pseudomonas aeruginosa]|uniref:gp436 family protein n=1 Tax=Pseudomonas aeruginosa TaxID=287 RepID=UPI00201189D0|nr:DUF1320 domain-containing protein [Pseudomonas aeruginosa]
MSYCTQADLVEQYGEASIRQLSDRVNKPATTIDPAVVAQAIADADAEIDLHLHARYQLPLAQVPVVLKRVACVLAFANLHTQVRTTTPRSRMPSARGSCWVIFPPGSSAWP